MASLPKAGKVAKPRPHRDLALPTRPGEILHLHLSGQDHHHDDGLPQRKAGQICDEDYNYFLRGTDSHREKLLGKPGDILYLGAFSGR
jgi:hypothetical protein